MAANSFFLWEARVLIGIAMGFSLASAPLLADDQSQPETRLMDLNVIAVDAHGEPVNDLTSEDFHVSDAGKQEKIAFFHHRENEGWQAMPLGPNEFSNRAGIGIPHATIILFDMLNEGFSSRGYAWNQITENLKGLRTAEYLYLYILTVDGRLFIVHGLPTVGERVRPPNTPPWTSQIKPLMDEAMHEVTRNRPFDIDIAVRTQLTFVALESLAVDLSRIPGRKNLVWITDGVPIALGPVRSDTGDFVDFTPLLRTLSEGLDRSGVAIYPVRQVIFGVPDGIGNTSGYGNTGGAGTGVQSIRTLDVFAGMTGGPPSTTKDIGSVIREALTDVNTSYQLGYYPPSRNWDNKFHKLRVVCKRKGVHIQAKTGYYAWTEPPGTQARQAFDIAASSQFDAAEIGLHARVSFNPRDARVAHLEVHIDAHDVAWVPEGNQYGAALRAAFVEYLTDGQTEGSSIVPLDLHYSPQERDEARKEGIVFTRDLTIDRNEDKVRFIVFDRGSNTFGSITIPIRTADPNEPR